MTDDEMMESIGRMQATGLVNRQLIACLYEIVLKDDPKAEEKLRAMSDELVPFFETTPNKVGAANCIGLVDSFLATLRARLGI